MDTKLINRNIRNQVSALFKQRHPSKGVVIDIPGFDEAIARRNDLMRRVGEHENRMVIILRNKDRLARTERRFGYIRTNVENGTALYSISVQTGREESIVSITIDDAVEQKTLLIGDPNTQHTLNEFVRKATRENAYVVMHDREFDAGRLEAVGVKLPHIANSIDLAFTTHVVLGRKRGTIECGALVGINRDDYARYNDYLVDVARAYIALPSIRDLSHAVAE